MSIKSQLKLKIPAHGEKIKEQETPHETVEVSATK